MALPDFIRDQPDGVLLFVKVQPRASKNAIGLPHGRELKVHVTAPPVDAAANEALIELLAETFDCGRNQIEMVRGQKSRHKILKLHGVDGKGVIDKLGFEAG